MTIPTPAPWASVDDVLTVTGVTVTDQQLAQAQGVIELLIGRTADATSLMRGSDLRWLKRAVAYEAAWLKDKPDLLTQTDVRSYAQDGMNADLKPDAQLLAPLARRALKRLSWRRSARSVQTTPTRNRLAWPYPASVGTVAIMEDTDWADNWRPT